jgi:thymidylate kinase
VTRLACELEAAGVGYCLWKKTVALAHAAAGEGDLDLLVSRASAQRFAEILRRLGFREALLSPAKRLPGELQTLGLDAGSGRLVKLDVHYQILVGDDTTKNYRLPIEEAYLASSTNAGLLRLPAPEFELALFVVRMVVKHGGWDALLTRRGSLLARERQELAWLSRRAPPALARECLQKHLPFIGERLWERCWRALQAECPLWFRLGTAWALQRALAGHARRPRAADAVLKFWRRTRDFLNSRSRRKGGKCLETGGAIIALVGGDGAGKTTAAEMLFEWLARDFRTVRLHLGKPQPGWLARVARRFWRLRRAVAGGSSVSGRSALKAASEGKVSLRAYARLVGEVLRARDRRRTYARARRLASNGALVICDRFPLPHIGLMDGAAGGRLLQRSDVPPLARYLAELERGYYREMRLPEILIVLRVHPDVAVERKRDEEDEAYVRPRSEEVWRLDWQGTPALVVDAGRTRSEVHAELKSLVWSRL